MINLNIKVHVVDHGEPAGILCARHAMNTGGTYANHEESDEAVADDLPRNWVIHSPLARLGDPSRLDGIQNILRRQAH